MTRRRPARLRIGVALLGVSCCAVCAAATAPVTLRDGRTIAADQVRAFTDQGVALRPALAEDGTPRALLVPWAEVAGVGQGGSASWGEAEAYRAVADALSRAELRLLRGDVPGALRLLGPLAERYLADESASTGPTSGPTSGTTNGPTTAQIASALVIGRTLRDDPSGAVHAWLAWRETREGPARAWIDPATGLSPGLPPVWTPADAADFLEISARPTGESEHTAELAGLYALAARHAAGRSEDRHAGRGEAGEFDAPSTRLRADAGVRLAWEMVRAQVDPELSGRRDARDALRRRLRSGSPAWEEAWAHLGIGVSLLGEPDPMDADAGAAELIGVILVHRDAAPRLAGLAMTLLIEYFDRTGRAGHAEAVFAMDREARRVKASGDDRASQRSGAQDDGAVGPTGDPIEEFP